MNIKTLPRVMMINLSDLQFTNTVEANLPVKKHSYQGRSKRPCNVGPQMRKTYSVHCYCSMESGKRFYAQKCLTKQLDNLTHTCKNFNKKFSGGIKKVNQFQRMNKKCANSGA